MTWILGAGAVAVGFTLFEHQAIRNGDIERADFISLLGNIILLGGALVLSLHLFNGMPLLHWLR
jgi:sensor histidine kinase regulating citrate/malate metabolism